MTAASLALAVGCSAESGPEETGPVEVDAPRPAAEDQDACRTLVDALPDSVADQVARPVTPARSWAAAWGDPAIVLTCGVPEPEGFKRTSSCITVNGVDWFIPEGQLESSEAVDLTMTTVHREQYVEVLLPAEYSPPATTLADLSSAVSSSIEAIGECV